VVEVEPSRSHNTELILHSLMARFTNTEYDDIHFAHICEGNARAATGEYQRQYPDRRQTDWRVFAAI
jgi:hypothetical protein